MKIFAAAAIAVAMATGIAIAQETSATSEGGATDAATYLKGPKVNDLYTDESRTSVRPASEFKQAWDKINDADRSDIKKACEASRDVSYNPLCTNVKGMM